MRSAKPKSWIALRPGGSPRRGRCAWAPWPALALVTLLAASAQAAPLLPGLEPEPPPSEASTPAPVSGFWGLFPRAEHMIESLPFLTPARDDMALDPSGLEAALLLDPSEESREAITQSLQESDLVRDMLGSTLAISGPGQTLASQTAGDTGLAVDDPGSADAGPGPALPAPIRPAAATGAPVPPPAPRELRPPEEQDDVALVQDDGLTLRTVARSIVTVRHPDPHQPAQTVTQSVATAANDVNNENFGLSERLLDSRMLGDMLQTVVRPYATYEPDNSFSIFGQGRFEMELDLSSGLGNINLTEASTGASVSMPLDEPPSYGDDPQPKQVEHIDLLDIVLNFLSSATGVFMMILAGCVAILFAMLRFALGLRR